MERHPKRVAFYGALVVIPTVVLIILDMIAGSIGETREIRNSSRMFRNEAIPLFLKTKNLLPSIKHYYQYGTREDPRYQGDPNAPRIFRTDDYGTIVSGPETHDVPPEQRILFLGGSSTECNEVDEEFRFPGFVGKLLSDVSGKSFKGINLGVRGNTSRDSVNLLLNHPAARTAKTVVLMHNINDRLLLALRGSYDSPVDGPAPTKWSAVSSAVEGTWVSLWNYLSHRSNLLFLLRYKVFDANPWTGEQIQEGAINEDTIDFRDAQLERSTEEFRTSLRTFVAVARAMGKQPVLMTQVLGKKSEPQKAFNQVTREIAAESKITLIDIEGVLNGHQQGLFLPDDIHLNNEGSRVIARIITDSLKSQLLGVMSTEEPFNRSVLGFDLSVCQPPPKDDNTFLPGPRRLLLRQSGRYPVLSHDGRFLLFQRWTGEKEVVELFDRKTGTYRTLSPAVDKVEDRHAVFFHSPDGRLRITFGRKENGIERVFIADVNGEAKPLPLPKRLSASIPAVTLEGMLLFAGSNTGIRGQPLAAPDLYRFNSISRTAERLTDTSWEEWRPTPDPTGDYIYYIADPDGQFDVFRLNLQTRKTTKFFGTDADEWDPDVSPDGRWVVFASKASGNWDLVIAPTETPSKSVNLTDGPADDWDPRVTPDGRAILFASSNAGAPPFMYFICPFGEFAR